MALLRTALESAKVDEKEIQELLGLAAKDPFLGEFVYKKKLKDLRTLSHDGKVVGFAIPRRDSDGHWRTGPIFVRQEYRSKGVAGEFIAAFFEGKRGRSYIEANNFASKRAFEKAGFKKTGKSLTDEDNVELFEYIKE